MVAGVFSTFSAFECELYSQTANQHELADHIKNISAKHEGGDPEVEAAREHPSDILEYFLPKAKVESEEAHAEAACKLYGQTRCA